MQWPTRRDVELKLTEIQRKLIVRGGTEARVCLHVYPGRWSVRASASPTDGCEGSDGLWSAVSISPDDTETELAYLAIELLDDAKAQGGIV